jgi:hypothetical protein
MEDLKVEQSEWTGKYMDNHVKEAMKWSVENQGVEVIELSPEAMAQRNAKLQPLIDQWIADAKEKGQPAEAIVADIQALIQKHAK